MLNTLIFLDIDGTLLDYSYKINYKELIPLLEKLQNDNVLALNSNRPLEDLLDNASTFKIEGLLIGENGIFMRDITQNTTTFLLNENEIEDLLKQKANFELQIKNTGKRLFGSKFHWFDVDTVKLNLEDYSSLPQGSIIVFNDKYRKYSMSAHIKKKEMEGIIKAVDELKLIFNEIKIKENPNVNLFYSDIFVNILLTSKLTNKRKAVEYLKANNFKEVKIIAIGDEIGDFEMVNGIGDFYAVQNASNEAKSKAIYVAKDSYAKGVYEILTSYFK